MIDENPHPDLTAAGLWGGVLAAGGAAVRALHTPQTWRSFTACVGVGLIVGSLACVLTRWQYPVVPLEVVVCAGGFVGFVSTVIAQTAVKITDRFLSRLSDRMDASPPARQTHPPGDSYRVPGSSPVPRI